MILMVFLKLHRHNNIIIRVHYYNYFEITIYYNIIIFSRLTCKLVYGIMIPIMVITRYYMRTRTNTITVGKGRLYLGSR